MDDTKKIIWLASYPKSGNTWFRAFLTALLNPDLKEVDINNMAQTTIASSRQLFDEVSGIESSDLTADEIDSLRPRIYRQNAFESNEVIYHKIHDAWDVLPDGTALFPMEATKGVLYFIRNPLDVAISFANHLNTSIDRTIEIMNNPTYAFCEKNSKLYNQLRQRLHTWSGHVKSWTEDSGLPLMVIRYEDMLTDTLAIFSKAVSFIGLDQSEVNIKKALDLSSFEQLRKQEETKGFSEKSAKSERFFRKGIAGDWKTMLSKEQVGRIKEAHSLTMLKFGY
ncbi:MAG TPA: sulfotransferase domain-containing protein [Bacteroidales bacterium]|nr:sulfotransferase domain-containing protein [Bacteroidales bacterium]